MSITTPSWENAPLRPFVHHGVARTGVSIVPSSLSFSRELEYKHHVGKKPAVRKRTPENIIEEFKLLKSQGYKAVNMQDVQFVWGEERTVKICEGIKDLDILWGCSARSDLLTEPLVKAMALANCKFVDLGVESFNQEILDYVKQIESHLIQRHYGGFLKGVSIKGRR